MSSVDIRTQLGLEPLADLTKWLNLLIYAEWGIGKTYLAATAQDCKATSPCLHLGFEQGLLTVAYRDGYEAKEIRTIDQLEKVHGLLVEDQTQKNPYYKCLILDNITELQTLDKDTLMRKTKKESNNPDKVNVDIPSPREWGIMKNRLRRVVQGFRDMPIHLICTSWAATNKDDDGNIINYYPNVQGSIKEELGGYFDIVGYYTQRMVGDEVKRELQVQGTSKVKAKWRNRPEECPGKLVDPTIQMIWDYVQMSKVGSATK